MTPNVKYPWEARLGDVAEAEITKGLSYFSKVTKITKDVGLDFYCESLENDSPSMPFHIQAKGTEHFDENWTGYIKKTTIYYWLQQSFPVFLIVYDEKEDKCYWMSIEENRYKLIESLYRTKSDRIPFKLDRSNIFEVKKGGNKDFIDKIKEDYYYIELFHGHPLLIGNGYVKKLPHRPRTDFELGQTKENVRVSLYSLVLHYSALNSLEDVKLICEFLVEFDKSHYNHFLWLGEIYKKLGDKDSAKRCFEEALKICERDKKWERESMSKIISLIKAEIASVT
jgi:tetratricopeptide (TPR) repeat protein